MKSLKLSQKLVLAWLALWVFMMVTVHHWPGWSFMAVPALGVVLLPVVKYLERRNV